jgi:tetratricopeptide (TPR) repeat protein
VPDIAPDLSAGLSLMAAKCLIELGQFDDALQMAVTATQAAEASGKDRLRARCLLARGNALSRLRRYESARQVLDDAAAIADKYDDEAIKAHALRLMAETWRHSLFGRYIQLTEEAYEAFERCGDELGAAECARDLAYLNSLTPRVFTRWDTIAQRATPATDVRGQAGLERSRALACAARFAFTACLEHSQRAADLAERCGALDVLFDAIATSMSCRQANGELSQALDAAHRLMDLADAQGNQRMRVVAAAHVAPTFGRAGNPRRGREELSYARSQSAEFGVAEEGPVVLSAAYLERDRGSWTSAAQGLHDAIRLAGEGGHVLFSLEYRIEAARVQLYSGATSSGEEGSRLRADALEAEAPLMASYIDAIFDQAAVLSGEHLEPTSAIDDACLEELATRADTAALLAELQGDDATQVWREARALWERLGFTIWLARAQARSGDLEAARHTLDVLDSPAEARAWALGEAAAS